MRETMNYYNDGSRYDLDYAARTSDIPFYVDRCVALGSDVLELGCGTGRITIPVAKKGINITGVDVSASMLERAKQKLSKTANNPDFIQADFRHFDIGRKFKMVIMPFNVLQHLYDTKSINQFFFCLQEHLEENATFILDVVNPDLYELCRNPNDHALYDSFNVIVSSDGKIERAPEGQGQLMVIEDKIHYDPITQIADYVLSYHIDNKELFDLTLKHRMFFPQELEEILHANGLQVLERFGDFDLSPFTANSPSQILVCMYKN
jgi:2-polyprenyl-3-methyl-5-hydroxy-6-metoxy-1,4-benzoquinol methylase